METCSANFLPGACVAQIARENGINDNLLFNWRLARNGGLQQPGEHETSLSVMTLTPEPDNKIPAPQVEQINTPSDSRSVWFCRPELSG